MNATAKKLLSLLVVLTLALALALPATAATLPTDCPICGAKNVTWNALTSATDEVKPVQETVYHGYLAEDVTMTGVSALQTASGEGAAYCLYLNGHTMTFTSRIRVRSNATLNIFGSGTVKRTASDDAAKLFAFNGNTTLNIHGGTFINEDPDVPMFQYQMVNQTVNIYGGTFKNSAAGFVENPVIKMTISGGIFDVDPTAYVAEGKAATAMDGGWYVADPGAPMPTEPEPTTEPTTQPTAAPTTPKTETPADAPSLTWLWIVLAVVVAGGGIGLVVWKKKK